MIHLKYLFQEKFLTAANPFLNTGFTPNHKIIF